MEFLVFALGSFVPTACDGVLMSKTTDMRIVADGSGVLVPVPDRLARWTYDLSIFSIVCETESHHVLAYVAFCLGQEIY